MKSAPDIATLAALLADPARANMLTALMAGKALTATELAQEAGVGASTASAHLAKLEQGGLISQQKQGRHRYFRLQNGDVAAAIEGLMGLAARTGHMRTRTGPQEPALREARACYDHLAGDLGVGLHDGLITRKLLALRRDALEVTAIGRTELAAFGIDIDGLGRQKRPVCKACLDWSERRNHLAGGLGAALLDRFYALRWAAREADGRVIRFSPRGREKLIETFGAPRRRGGP